jgi:uncharacterized membrane protein
MNNIYKARTNKERLQIILFIELCAADISFIAWYGISDAYLMWVAPILIMGAATLYLLVTGMFSQKAISNTSTTHAAKVTE